MTDTLITSDILWMLTKHRDIDGLVDVHMSGVTKHMLDRADGSSRPEMPMIVLDDGDCGNVWGETDKVVCATNGEHTCPTHIIIRTVPGVLPTLARWLRDLEISDYVATASTDWDVLIETAEFHNPYVTRTSICGHNTTNTHSTLCVR